MAEHLGASILEAMRASAKRRKPVITRNVANALADWFDHGAAGRMPWLKTESRWLAILSEMLFDRVRPEIATRAWPAVSRMKTPRETIRLRIELEEMATYLGRMASVKPILESAAWFLENPAALSGRQDMSEAPNLDEATLAIARHVAPGEDGHPIVVTNGGFRVAARFNGEDMDGRNRRTDGRIATARLIGDGERSRSAVLGLIELSRAVCLPKEPLCHECPLLKWCVTGSVNVRRQPALF
jgi:DNA (cytosine-5)-methyltransferase 1